MLYAFVVLAALGSTIKSSVADISQPNSLPQTPIPLTNFYYRGWKS